MQLAKIFLFRKRDEEEMLTVFDVADFFLTKESMTHKKLQKLCYYAYAWYYTLYNERLFPNRFEAWIHGPVYPDLYHEYKAYGWQEIEKKERHGIDNEKVLDLLERVYATYGEFDGDQLEILTHREQPWIQARQGVPEYEPSNNPIRDEVIKQYYLSLYEKGQND